MRDDPRHTYKCTVPLPASILSAGSGRCGPTLLLCRPTTTGSTLRLRRRLRPDDLDALRRRRRPVSAFPGTVTLSLAGRSELGDARVKSNVVRNRIRWRVWTARFSAQTADRGHTGVPCGPGRARLASSVALTSERTTMMAESSPTPHRIRLRVQMVRTQCTGTAADPAPRLALTTKADHRASQSKRG